ncbi:hypothetical protein GCM10010345_42420 [Streptomyces canarius]|uniref:Uncharacterized protein n=1 Tax=Streptomyces canarius TaxID=285453 RepID=A0ABQ3CQI7_9ACTN|nr:hypothetical protein GCM10010345_42420 [Streptomyces canarius]
MLPEPYRTFVAEIVNGTDDGPPDTGGLLPVGEKPESWAVWEAEYWMSPTLGYVAASHTVRPRTGEEGTRPAVAGGRCGHGRWRSRRRRSQG